MYYLFHIYIYVCVSCEESYQLFRITNNEDVIEYIRLCFLDARRDSTNNNIRNNTNNNKQNVSSALVYQCILKQHGFGKSKLNIQLKLQF